MRPCASPCGISWCMMPLPAVIHCTSPAPSTPLLPRLSPWSTVAGQHVGDGLDAAVRMPGEAGEVVVGIVVAEIVQQQERIELLGLAEAEGAAQLHAGALHGRLGLDDAFHGTDGHDTLTFRVGRDCSDWIHARARRHRRREARDQRGELVDEGLQESPRALVGDGAVVVDQAGLEGDIGLAAHQENAQVAEHLAQMLLRERGADRARRGAGDGGELAGPGVLAPRPRAPVDGVLEHGRDRAVVLGRHEQHAVGGRDLGLEADDARRQLALDVLIVDRQIVDLDEVERPAAGAPSLASACASLRLMDSRRLLPTIDGDLEFGHGDATFWSWLRFDTEAR